MAKRICTLSLLCALCMALSYLESLLPFAFIAPGVRLGLANAAALLLLQAGDVKGAFAVNIARILLSALLFGTVMSLSFSLAGGIASLIVMSLLRNAKSISPIGFSVAGGAVHNLFQLGVACCWIGQGVLFYLPILLLCGAVSGALIGFCAVLLSKRISLRIF
ncbi:MAG: Gx transporter family protein [Clostridia bacterium]|nr:Gx transporter family protein [Clostridia bacterium]